MREALAFYTNILDFEMNEPGATSDDWVVLLSNGDAELMLTSLREDQKMGINANVLVDDIDGLFQKYLNRGLDITNKKGSPVHQGSIDQSWGNREFYVTDADGNTLRFFKPFL
jgi:uncharacterized glyoxalase superfamily protein PhnB